jgi:hypothetical protein
MEAKIKTELGDKLYDACKAGTLDDVLACITPHRENDSSYHIYLFAMM